MSLSLGDFCEFIVFASFVFGVSAWRRPAILLVVLARHRLLVVKPRSGASSCDRGCEPQACWRGS